MSKKRTFSTVKQPAGAGGRGTKDPSLQQDPTRMPPMPFAPQTNSPQLTKKNFFLKRPGNNGYSGYNNYNIARNP